MKFTKIVSLVVVLLFLATPAQAQWGWIKDNTKKLGNELKNGVKIVNDDKKDAKDDIASTAASIEAKASKEDQSQPPAPTGVRVVEIDSPRFRLNVGRDQAIEQVRAALRVLGYVVESTNEGVIKTETKVSRYKKSEDWVEVDVLTTGEINVRAMHREGRTVTITAKNNNPAVEKQAESIEVANKLRSKLTTLIAAR